LFEGEGVHHHHIFVKQTVRR